MVQQGQSLETRNGSERAERAAAAPGPTPVADSGRPHVVIAAAGGRPHEARGAASGGGAVGEARTAGPSAAGGPGAGAATSAIVASGPRSAGSAAPRPGEPLDGAHARECSALLAYLRAAVDKLVPTVVIAGAGMGGGAAGIADGMAIAARDGGLRLFSAELGGSSGRPVLQQRRVVPLAPPGRGDLRLAAGGRAGAPAQGAAGAAGAAPPAAGGGGRAAGAGTGAAGRQGAAGSNGNGGGAGGNGGAGEPGPAAAAGGASRVAEAAAPGGAAGSQAATALEPRPAGAAGIERWFEEGSGGVDFILVEAPPLDTTADAALLARACDGLVLVVESGVTSRESLLRAVRIAEASGCRLLGLVMSEPRQGLPDWVRRLVSGTSGRSFP
jgi:hypothetical protein